MNSLKRTGKRMLALLLCLTLALSVPVMPAPSAQAIEADHWLAPYLDKMTSWDIVKGDGNGDYHTEDNITRAEFVAMLNRAYGYTDVGPIPFTDVGLGDWFYDDIRKAYTAGVFHGTSETTASPYDPITREQAVTLIARNMRMDETPGEIIDFTDGREFSYFSRGYVKSAIAAGIINGYTDGTVKPLNNVTRGEAIKMMCVGIGSLINTPGTHSPGGVFGNLTINCTNVTLKDTIITGDLYISGGISLGDVVLENVQVRGRIVVAGGGSSELGQNSVLLRGVDTSKLVVDAPTGQYISVRTEGRTHIDNAAFRSDSFFEDACRDGYGILNVSLEGAPGDSFTLSGNLENVVNRTPDSTLILGDAQASSVTVDEKATGSKLILEVNASADEVNLDVGTSVEGSGDIGHLTINSTGSSTTMLPDTITIRPGLNADIAGDDMDASEAEEYSEEPRILNGYPKVANVAPTTADGINSTNKQGTIYWGLTTAAVGAVPDTEEGRQSLISPSYGSGFLLSGSYPATSSEIDLTIPERLTGLTSSGTYFVSAVLQDVRGHVSPVYSERFETPDDIVPAFSSGDYPYMSSIEVEDPEVTVMANKNCDMYYALFPQGSTQPSVNDFLSFAGFDDALGYGRVRLTKNKTWTEQVNKIIYPESMDREDFYTGDLVERASYDLYLWLADADGIKSSAITKLTFTTRDKTPPEFTTDMQQTTMGATNVGVNCVINEAGTVHWALVKTGTEYPKLPKDWDVIYNNSIEEFLRSEEAKFQVSNHQNAFKTGSINTNGNADASANITGLERETAYDLYYVAVDSAGNYSDTVKKITVYTEDSTPPTATLAFSRVADSDSEIPQPYADSDVRIVFSENILDRVTGAEPLELYQTMHSAVSSTTEKNRAKERLVSILGRMITMYQRVGNTPSPVTVTWENAALELDRDGQMIITLPTTGANAAVTLGSGSQYYFAFQDITDASPQKNEMVQRETPMFTTVSALARLSEITATSISDDTIIDIGFSITPESTNSAASGTYWDMMLWLDTPCKFKLYGRVLDEDEDSADSNKEWKQIGGEVRVMVPTGTVAGSSLVVMTRGNTTSLPFLLTGGRNEAENLLEGKVYEYALHFTEMNGNTDRKSFNGSITCEATVIAGSQNNVSAAFIELDKDKLAESIKNDSVRDITAPQGFSITKPFSDQTAPEIADNHPTFTPGDGGVTMTLALKNNRVGRVHYLITPENVLSPKKSNGDDIEIEEAATPGGVAAGTHKYKETELLTPTVDQVVQPDATLGNVSNLIAHGTVLNVGSATIPVDIDGLSPKTTYYAYLVTQGSSNQYSDIVYIYKFTTLDITRPVLTLRQGGSNITVQTSLPSTTDISYIIVPYSSQMGSELFRYLSAEITTEGPNKGKHDAGDVDTKSGIKKPNTTDEYYRIFETMGTNASPQTDGSLFDQKATTGLKESLSDYIRTQGVDNQSILARGSGTATSSGGLVVDCSNPEFHLSTNLQYCFIAVGKSALSSATNPESYAFRATYPFRLDDTQPPKVTQAVANVPSWATDALQNKNIFGGTITLTFDKPLYMLYGSGTSEKLYTVSTNTQGITTPTSSSEFISAESLINNTGGNSVNVQTDATKAPQAITAITLNVRNMTNNSVITFDSGLCNASRRPGTTPLSIRVNIVTNRDGIKDVQVTIPNYWKATTFTN